jgi:hypothetical protein
MFPTPEQSARALYRVIDVTNACLQMLGKREKPTYIEFELDTKGNYIDRSVSVYR